MPLPFIRRGLAVASLCTLAALPACASHVPRPIVPADELAALRHVSLASVAIEREAAEASAASGAHPESDAHTASGAHPAMSRFDLADGLDEAELVSLALTGHPELRARRAALGESRALLVSAGLWPDPELSFSVRPGINGAGSTAIGGDLLLDVFAPDERPARRALAEAQVEVVRADVVAAELAVSAEVRRARLDLLASEQRVVLLAQEAALADEARTLVRRQREIGETTDLALSLVELEQVGAARRLREVRAAAEDALAVLDALIGLPPGTPLPLTELGQPLAFTLRADLGDDALDRAVLEGNPVLHLRQAAHEAAEQELRLAIARSFPRLALGPAYEREVDGSESFGLGASLELPLWNRNQGEIAQAGAARDRAHAEYVAALHAARAAAWAARAELRRARAEVELQEREIVPLAARTDALFEGALRAGDLTVFEWLTARARSVELHRGLLDALLRYAHAATALDAATGAAPGLTPHTEGGTLP